MKGVFIPEDFFDLDLNVTEMVVLSIYKYFTEEGKYKCCTMTNEEIAKKVKMSGRNLQIIKKHLKDLGYIRSDGGIKVYYIGVNRDETGFAPGVKYTSPRDETGFTPGVKNPANRGETGFTHNNNKKIKKEIKKEEMTNFDLVVDNLPKEYNTPEKIDFLLKEKADIISIINNVPEINSSNLESMTIRVKNVLMQEYPTEYKIVNKVEDKKDDFMDLY